MTGAELLARTWAEVRQWVPDIADTREVHLANLMRTFYDAGHKSLRGVVRKRWPESKEAYRMFLYALSQ